MSKKNFLNLSLLNVVGITSEKEDTIIDILTPDGYLTKGTFKLTDAEHNALVDKYNFNNELQ